MRIRAGWLKNNWVIVLAIIWFVAGFILLGTYQAFDWIVLTGFATWMLAGGVIAAFWQISQARKSTSAQVAIGLSQKLRDTEVLDILQKIYELEPERIASLSDSTSEEDKKLEREIIRVLDNIELLGALVAQGIIDKDVAIVAYGGPTALKCWYKLNAYIKELRSGKAHSLACKYLEDFAARTWERFHHEGEKIYFYRVKGEKSIDLVKYFQKCSKLRPERYR